MDIPRRTRADRQRSHRRALIVALAIAPLAAAIPAADARAATDGLVAAYSFDAGSGTTLADASGNGHGGTVVGATWTSGKHESALSFNGTNARVDLPALGTFYKTGFTLEAWVKKSTTKLDTGIVGSWDYPQGGGPMLWVDHLAGRYHLTMNTGLSSYLDSGQTPTAEQWQHLTGTYDGATARFYLDGVLVASRPFTGNVGDSDDWHIGAYGGSPGQFFDGVIDDVRIYDRALTGSEIQADLNEGVAADTTPPSAPTNFAKTSATATRISTSWTASTDNVGVAGYQLLRGGTPVDSAPATSYTFTGLSCGTSYQLAVRATDGSGNLSAPTPLTASTDGCDTTAPTVTITAQAGGATVSGTVPVEATASDNDNVAGVQFKLNGANLGAEDTSSPYGVDWSAGGGSPGSHTLTAVARDASGNTVTSPAVTVTVAPPPPGSAPVAAYSFDDGAGTVLGDATGNGNQGTVVGASWATGKFGSALSFNGTSSRVDLPALGKFYRDAFTLEAWVKTSTTQRDTGIVGSFANGGPMLWVDHLAGRYYLTMGAGISNYLDSGQTPTTGQWQHVTGTYDGATARFYVDGTLVASQPFTDDVGDSNNWRIGAYGNPAGQSFDGLIDDVRIYDRALTSAQVQADMATPVTTGPAVLSTSPANGASGVKPAPTISASFNQAMLASSITTSTFQLRDASSTLVPATVSYSAATGKASIAVTNALTYGATYTATVKGGANGVKSASGAPLAADRSWSFTVESRRPMLVLTSPSRPMSTYAAQLLKAEGLEDFTTLDLSLATTTVLNGFDEVIVGDLPLTTTQVSMLTSWVVSGGNLIALRPDAKLAGLLGLTSQGTTLSNGYLKVNTAAGTPGAGIVGETIQYHGTADRYSLNGATAVATLYSSATTATTSPAVTLRSIGSNGGQAAAFTYDLARSVIYTRQGNPAWVGQDRDGTFPVRTNDLFYGAKTGDVQPDWINLTKAAIPQADEQQRLLANLATRMGEDRKPLPRFWYLPKRHKAVVVLTGDDHAMGGTAGRFDDYLAKSPAGCSVTDWECVRSTSYVYPASPLTPAQAADYASIRFEIALHTSPAGVNQLACANWTPAALPGIFDEQLLAFRTRYSTIPAPVSQRMHCVTWTDWATQAKVELANGIRLDTNYYYYPSSWMATKPGFMTGSGQVMRFADSDGSVIDVWQANTQITDESGQAEPATINAMLDNALGSAGYYGAFVANIHTDNAASTASDAIIASAKARNVPVVSAKQLLKWVDGRDRSSFQSFGWSNRTLTFKVDADSAANNLQAMLPIRSGSTTLQAITRNGSVGVPFTTQTIKGIAYGFFDAASGSYSARYG